MAGRDRRLDPEEAALWARVIATVKPIERVKPPTTAAGPSESRTPPKPLPVTAVSRRTVAKQPLAPAARPHPNSSPEGEGLRATLDAGWDRRLSRGLVTPESSIDLHGHSLATAYDRLDRGLEAAIARGDRILLLVTGKPPRPDAERPYARGAIRSAVHDWIASSRHSSRIAAVRGAHPRHGGAGALYIVLRRARTTDSPKF